jgi:hypothetical protein
MKLTYQTGVAALIHLAVITLFNIVNALHGTIKECVNNGANDCVETIITSSLYFILITLWFVALWMLAVGAQTRRSRKLAFLLIGGEFMVFIVAIFNAKHHNDLLGLTTSLVDAALAVWVGVLAFRIFRAGGGRVTTSNRSRRRRLSND